MYLTSLLKFEILVEHRTGLYWSSPIRWTNIWNIRESKNKTKKARTLKHKKILET